MKLYRMRRAWTGLLAAVLLAACATPPAPEVPPPPAATEVEAELNASAMLPLLAYFQRLHRM